MDFLHIPVLLEEVLSILPESLESVVDFTLGGAGHATAILNKHPDTKYFGIDRDQNAIEASTGRLEPFQANLSTMTASFSIAIDNLINNQIKTDFILADLGVSSHQLDQGDRGFSFRSEAPLDMRMDQNGPLTAADIVNTYSERDLIRVLKRYGEESFANRIVKAIIRHREKEIFKTTWQLADCVREGVPKKFQFGKSHPATKTFQALRIEVNDELGELGHLLEKCLCLLRPKGRIAIISFHSLEDRIVKTYYKKWADPCECPKNIPYCVCGKEPEGDIITRKIMTPGKKELIVNPRSRSAKLRVFQKK